MGVANPVVLALWCQIDKWHCGVKWYYGAMIRETKAYDCTCEKCGYTWFSPTVPARCSGCKNRKWNEGIKPEKMIIEKPTKVERVRDPEPEKAKLEAPSAPQRFSGCPDCGAIGGMHQRFCKRK